MAAVESFGTETCQTDFGLFSSARKWKAAGLQFGHRNYRLSDRQGSPMKRNVNDLLSWVASMKGINIDFIYESTLESS